ncbi:unnamed protein product [Calypogeia fissa]
MDGGRSSMEEKVHSREGKGKGRSGKAWFNGVSKRKWEMATGRAGGAQGGGVELGNRGMEEREEWKVLGE